MRGGSGLYIAEGTGPDNVERAGTLSYVKWKGPIYSFVSCFGVAFEKNGHFYVKYPYPFEGSPTLLFINGEKISFAESYEDNNGWAYNSSIRTYLTWYSYGFIINPQVQSQVQSQAQIVVQPTVQATVQPTVQATVQATVKPRPIFIKPTRPTLPTEYNSTDMLNNSWEWGG